LEDSKDYEKALDYISTLPFSTAESNMMKYGKAMMSALPERTTSFLMSLCTFYVPQHNSEFVERPADGNSNLPSSILADLDLMMEEDATDEAQKAPPEEFFHIFINNEEWLVKLLEYVIEKDPSEHDSAVYNTLLELYLQDDDLVDMEQGEKRRVMEDRYEKARRLLQNEKSVFDDHHALALCRQHNFKEGILFLYKRQEMFNEIIEYHMDNNEYKELIQACKLHGGLDPNLWVHTLSYFARKPEDDCLPELSQVLEYIDRDNLVPPLLVLKILKQKQTATLGLIKKYIVRRLTDDQEQINVIHQQIKDNTRNTQDMKDEIKGLRTTARIFKINKCSQCQQPLDLPAVHFLCMHSYHAGCMGEEDECWLCADENRHVLEIKRSLEANVGQHDQFFKQLKESHDGFATAAEYFGRGVFNKPIKE